MAALYEPPPDTRVYAIGDIHGRLDLLRQLRALIVEDMARAPVARAVVVYLGDYVDRGPASKQVVEALISEPVTGATEIHLKGNHEDLLLRFHDSGDLGETWLMNGGGATLASYGIAAAIDPFDALWQLDELRADLRRRLPAHHQAFLRGLALDHREGGYLFVHAGVRPGVALAAQSAEDRIWIRDEFLSSDADFGAFVVHGHTPRPDPVVKKNRIGINTMAYRSGTLTCLALEGAERRFITT
jgi:serine/threonine protein phosphatase 1